MPKTSKRYRALVPVADARMYATLFPRVSSTYPPCVAPQDSSGASKKEVAKLKDDLRRYTLWEHTHTQHTHTTCAHTLTLRMHPTLMHSSLASNNGFIRRFPHAFVIPVIPVRSGD